MVTIATLVASLILLFPAIVTVALRSREDSAEWEIALDAVLALAVDLLLVLALSFVVTLEVAAWLSRSLWAGGAIGVVFFRKRRDLGRPKFPSALRGRALVFVLAGVVVALLLSVWLSRTYSVWDRRWHIPLVASMRGQSLPFVNIFNPRETLHYHFAGHVHAAMLQTYSFLVIHSALALSLAHDIHFALIGMVLTLLMRAWGFRSFVAAALAAAAVLLTGPFTIFREGIRQAQHGYSLINYMSLSFRPHMALGALWSITIVGTVLARADAGRELSIKKTMPVLIAAAAALAITDETSLAELGVVLGIIWLFEPNVIAPNRKTGAIGFLLLAIAFAVPNLAFSAALAPGGEKTVLTLVPFRSPGCFTPPLPLSTAKGRLMLVYDILPLATILVGAAVSVFAFARTRARTIAFALGAGVFTLGTLCLIKLDVNQSPLENHRFMTAPLLLVPVVAIRLFKSSRYAAAFMALGLALGPLSTMHWLWFLAPQFLTKHDHFFANIDHYRVNCQAETDVHFGSRARAQYLAKPVWFLYAGCVPVYAPGKPNYSKWQKLTIGNPLFDLEQAKALSELVPPDRSLRLVCPMGAQTETLCRAAVAAGTCRVVGPSLQSCTLDPGARAATLQ